MLIIDYPTLLEYRCNINFPGMARHIFNHPWERIHRKVFPFVPFAGQDYVDGVQAKIQGAAGQYRAYLILVCKQSMVLALLFVSQARFQLLQVAVSTFKSSMINIGLRISTE